MRVVAIASGKGGSGKTTATVNLAAALAERGGRVLVIDTDPQASASRWLGAEGAASPLAALFEAEAERVDLAAAVMPTTAAGVDLVPSSPALGRVARNAPPDTVTALRAAVRQLPHGRWTYVLIDTPPGLDLLTLSAMMAASFALVPADASAVTLDALAPTLATIARVAESGDGLALAGLLVGRLDARQAFARDVLELLRDRRGDDVFTTTISETVRLREAAAMRQPVTAYDPKGKAAADFRAAAAELEGRTDGS